MQFVMYWCSTRYITLLRDQKKREKTEIIEHISKTKMDMGWTHRKHEKQQMDQAMHRVATKEREKIKKTTKQKVAR